MPQESPVTGFPWSFHTVRPPSSVRTSLNPISSRVLLAATAIVLPYVFPYTMIVSNAESSVFASRSSSYGMCSAPGM